MYMYKVQTAYIFPRGLRLNDANKIIKLIAIYCYDGYFLNIMNQQLNEWYSADAVVRVARVPVLSMS